MAKRGRNETPKHKIEKFDVRRFMGVLERSKVARYSSFRGSLYFSSRSSRGLSTVDFCCRALSLPGCLSFKRNPPPLFNTDFSPVFTYLKRELPLRHLRDDLSRATVSFSPFLFLSPRLKSIVFSNFHSIALTRSLFRSFVRRLIDTAYLFFRDSSSLSRVLLTSDLHLYREIYDTYR